MSITNRMGYDQIISTLTHIDSKILKTKYYTLDLKKYINVEIGRGGVSSTVMNWVVQDNAGSFEKGFASNSDEARMASVDVNIGSKMYKRVAWKKVVSYDEIDIRQAQVTNFSEIEQKLEARKKNWDLGIQKMVFTGNKVDTQITGLLNNPEVEVDTTTITKSISSMSATEFQDLIGTILGSAVARASNTVVPNRLLIPVEDYLGLGMASSPDFPMISKLEYFEKAMKAMVGKMGEGEFEILPCAYCDATNPDNPTGKSLYVLYNKDSDNLVFDMALPYTTTAFATSDNFNWYNVAYGMVGGANIYRPETITYFQY